jgi:hypothetical protein
MYLIALGEFLERFRQLDSKTSLHDIVSILRTDTEKLEDFKARLSV